MTDTEPTVPASQLVSIAPRRQAKAMVRRLFSKLVLYFSLVPHIINDVTRFIQKIGVADFFKSRHIFFKKISPPLFLWW